METLGIKDTREFIAFVAPIAREVASAVEDGVQTVNINSLLPALMTAGEAFDGITMIPKELADLSEEEFSELKSVIIDEIGFEDDKEKLELIVSKSLTAAFALHGLVSAILS